LVVALAFFKLTLKKGWGGGGLKKNPELCRLLAGGGGETVPANLAKGREVMGGGSGSGVGGGGF